MLCPACRDPLVILEVEGVELDMCVQRHGLWFDAQELGQLFEICDVPEELRDLESRLEVLPQKGARRLCPRCRARMRLVRAPNAPDTPILDQCPQGHGLWFDRGELEALLASLLGDEDEALKHVRTFLGTFVEPLKSAREGEREGEEAS